MRFVTQIRKKKSSEVTRPNQNVDIDEEELYEVWLAEGEADYDEMIIRDSEDYFDFDDFRLGA